MRINIFLSALVGLMISTIAGASTYDAFSDFSSFNPSGAWAYGTGVTGVSFTPMTVFTANACFGVSGVSCWQPPTTVLSVPVVARNGSGTAANFGTVVLPSNALMIHPGPSTDTVVTWTALTAGTYNISGFFELLDTSPSGVVTSIFDNASQVFTATLTGPPAMHPSTVGGRQSFSLTENVTAGTTLSFGVNNDGSFFDDSTGFSASITQVSSASPEPTSLILFGAGIAGLAALRLRRRRQQSFRMQ